MSEYFSSEKLRSEAQLWAKTKQQCIAAALNDLLAQSNLPALGVDQYFSLSELNLCKAFYYLQPPGGYKVTTGTVRVYDPDETELMLDSVQHAFAHNGDWRICITFGQFFGSQHGGAGLRAGDRVAAYYLKAPHLVTLLDSGLAVLHGHADEIKAGLGLEYLTY